MSWTAVAWLKAAEAKQPGIIKSCADALGRNLLWYTLYNWHQASKVQDTLLKHGCDPDARATFGPNWREMEAAKEESDASMPKFFLNGVPAREVPPEFGKDCPTLDTVKIILVDGAVMEWKWADSRARFVRDVSIGVDSFSITLNWSKDYWESFGRAVAVFRRDPDGLYRFTGMQDA